MQRSGAERAFGRERTPPSTTPDRWLQRPIGDCCARLCFSGCSPVMLAPIRCASARKAALARTQERCWASCCACWHGKKTASKRALPSSNHHPNRLDCVRSGYISIKKYIGAGLC